MLEYDVVVLAAQRLDKVTSIKARDIFLSPMYSHLAPRELNRLLISLTTSSARSSASFLLLLLFITEITSASIADAKNPQKHTNFEHGGVHRGEEYQKDHSKRDGGCEPQEACLF